MITITKTNFEHEVLHSAKPVIIDVYSATCHSCRVNNDIINRLDETRDDIKVGKFDIDEEQALTEEFEITSVPAVLVFKDVVVHGDPDVVETQGRYVGYVLLRNERRKMIQVILAEL